MAVLVTSLLVSTASAQRSQNVSASRATLGKSLFVSPRGSDANACTRAAPCRTFDRAYRAAAAGGTVLVGAGTYPGEEIEVDASKSSDADVVFRPAPGAGRPLIAGKLSIYGSHMTFENLDVKLWYARPGADDLTFSNLDVDQFFIASASNVRVLGGDAGPVDSSDITQIKKSPGHPPPTNILIDGVYFHDATKIARPRHHTDCLQFGSGVNVTIRNSRFENCSDANIFIRSWSSTPGQHPLQNFLIENNWLDATLQSAHGKGNRALHVGSNGAVRCEDFLIRNNSLLGTIIVQCPPGGSTGIQVLANISTYMTAWKCSQMTGRWDWNLYKGSVRCGRHDRVGSPRFRDPRSFDLRLKPCSPAIGRGDPRSFPSTDIRGVPRPAGRAPDAGAVEITAPARSCAGRKR